MHLRHTFSDLAGRSAIRSCVITLAAAAWLAPVAVQAASFVPAAVSALEIHAKKKGKKAGKKKQGAKKAASAPQ